MSFPRYPAYKDSRVEWLGEVPAHWGVLPVKNIADIINGYPFDSELFSTEYGTPLVRIRDLNKITTDTNYIGEIIENAVITSDDVLIGMDGEFNVGRWQGEGIALLNQRMCCIRGKDSNLTMILEYALPIPLKSINDVTYSTTVKHLSSNQIAKIFVTLPPDKTEQHTITAFLDRETAKIDALVAEQETLIALLAEKRQATISHAVTKGLTPAVPMKDSGIEWLGAVPEHWDVVTLGRITLEKCDGPFGSGLKSEHYTDEGVRVVRLQNIRMYEYYQGDEAYIDTKYYETDLQRHSVLEDDILIAGLGDDKNLVGRACVAPQNIGVAIVKADCFRFRIDTKRASPKFAAIQLSATADSAAGLLSGGSTRSRISLHVMASRVFLCPPLAEQQAIVAHLDRETARLDALTAEARRAIDLLKERRSALISAAVTGKIDVRGRGA